MRSSDALIVLLVASSITACFIDDGFASSGKTSGAASSEGSSSGEASSGATSDSTGTSGSLTTGPTSGATATSSPPTTSTSSDPTTGPTTSSTGEPSCEGECSPGEVEVGEGCESCGLQERACTAACTWGSWACVDHPESCGFWRLPTGSKTWEHYPLEGKGGLFAPQETIQAAFDVADRDEGWVLTGTSYHVLDLNTLTWKKMGPRSEFDNLGGSKVIAAYSVNDGEGGNQPDGQDNVTLHTSTSILVYDISLATGNITYLNELACCDEQWNGPDSPDLADVRASWLDLQNEDKWLDTPVGDCGGLPPDSPIDWYLGVITNSQVHISEIGNCFEFKDSMPFNQYPPFTYDGAPDDPTVIGAAYYADGLWLFKGE